MVKTDRSFLKLILLSSFTCGIYGLIFWNDYINDMNTIGNGDGQETPNLVKLILLSAVTCGIYGLIFYYNLGNRLADNGARYNVNIHENGSTILLWMLAGSLIGIGPFVALYILVKNINMLANAYNAN